jgi:hypothetical protein
VMPVAPVSWVKQFSYPPVLEDAPMYAAHARVPSLLWVCGGKLFSCIGFLVKS